LTHLYRAGHMPLCDVSNFMGEDTGQFAFRLGVNNRPGIDADNPTGRGKGIDCILIYNKKRIQLAGIVALCDQPVANRLYIGLYLRVIDDIGLTAYLIQEGLSQASFEFRAEYVPGGVTNIGQVQGGDRTSIERGNQGQEKNFPCPCPDQVYESMILLHI
jgi:hypothetical protein